jgi:hypothetical protein|tara:strand:+ start:845 stop:1645 length:801 start_codon:yes stop_codon:yes gene_type:complete
MTLLALVVSCYTLVGCGSEDPVKPKSKKNSVIAVDSVYASDLDGGMLPDGLLNELATQGVKMGTGSEVKVNQKGREWLITDKENQQAYTATIESDKITFNKATYIDYELERDAVAETYKSFVTNYNERELTNVYKLWTNKSSDYLIVNIAENETIYANGQGVRGTLEKLAKGHHSTKNDRWNGSDISEMYMRSRGGRLEAGIHTTNALRHGETWAYLVKIGKKWLINKVESIETRNLAGHKKIEIHAKAQLDGIGYFDDKKHLVKL